MSKKRRQVRTLPKPGSRPGTLVVPAHAQETGLQSIVYNAENCITEKPSEPSEAAPSKGSIVWLNVVGLANVEFIKSLQPIFGAHPLLLEDMVHVPQRPKFQVHDSVESLILRMNHIRNEKVQSEQLTILWGDNFVVTVQEREGDTFDPIRKRLNNGAPIRTRGPSYLAYALLDAVIDHHFLVMDHYGQKLANLDEIALENPGPNYLKDVQTLKKDLAELRTNLWSTREALSEMLKHDSKLITEETKLHLRDCQDHCRQILENLESLRDSACNLVDLYLSGVAHKTNEVMQHLTLIATIFIPLSFLAGVFGMNFEHMPELKWRWSYPLFWLTVVLIVSGMTGFFIKRGWIKFR